MSIDEHIETLEKQNRFFTGCRVHIQRDIEKTRSTYTKTWLATLAKRGYTFTDSGTYIDIVGMPEEGRLGRPDDGSLNLKERK